MNEWHPLARVRLRCLKTPVSKEIDRMEAWIGIFPADWFLAKNYLSLFRDQTAPYRANLNILAIYMVMRTFPPPVVCKEDLQRCWNNQIDHVALWVNNALGLICDQADRSWKVKHADCELEGFMHDMPCIHVAASQWPWPNSRVAALTN